MAPIDLPRPPLGDEQARPTVSELHGDEPYAVIARKLWLKSTKSVRVKADVLKSDIWEPLERENFPFRALLILENLQVLERYLWPGYTEDSSNQHVLLIALILNIKSRENLMTWDHFVDKPAEFSSLFRRILSMTLDASLSRTIRTNLLCFIINAFQSLDSGLARKECAPLVSISIWHNLSTDASREVKFEKNGQWRKAWRAAAKRYDAADDEVKARLRFDRSWLYSVMLDFLSCLQEIGASPENVIYCERFVEFLTDLESQLPTRRYVNTLVHDLNLVAAIRLSPVFNDEDNGLFRDLYSLFQHFVYFSVDDHTGLQLSQEQSYENHCANLARLQRTSLKHFKEKLTLLALSNYGSIEQRVELSSHLENLTDPELIQLCDLLGFRTSYPKAASLVVNKTFLQEILLSAFERRKTYQESIKDLSILPTEGTLYEPSLLRNETYNGSRPLAIPKLTVQYLTVGDFLWRSFILHRCESFFEIRKDIEDVIKRLQPGPADPSGGTKFSGFSRMALPISRPGIIETTPPKVGETKPSLVRAEITLDLSRMNENVKREWNALKPDDVVFLLAVHSASNTDSSYEGSAPSSPAENFGLKYVRAAQVLQVLDENGRSLRVTEDGRTNGHTFKSRIRRLQVSLDASMYKLDLEKAEKSREDVYDSINVLIRRRGRENNFKPILESIRNLSLAEVPIPSWLKEVFLGYGDPSSANYTRLPNRLQKIDFRDTFLDWQHLVESFPGKTIEPNADAQASFGPPYIIESAGETSQAAPPKQSKKRRRDQVEPTPASVESILVSTYTPLNMGPYPIDTPKLNSVRFTPAQIEAIASGTQPGLTVILGPPGTGKTDVATQIINNIYHNFSEQRTLLVAHSNQALNQLFQKITALDIDERHLLRLGHGEEDLDTEISYSKYGRVESFLENRTRYLAEVDRLAANFGAPGAHGSSCETAGYFHSVYVAPAWAKFQERAKDAEATALELADVFPFHNYFSNAPQPLFLPNCTREDFLEIAEGCYRHIEKIFSELEDIRPFEILRNNRDKANYLLIKEARIIAMTSTHAAIRRQEIAGLGFHYDNVIMEEAAQITEIENFIPLALQHPRNGELSLQRVVLCGDHLQNSPIIQNLAFRQYARMEQSLFQRLVRLGVPTVTLDRQGRARPSIAELYSWRYKKLDNLPIIEEAAEFQAANAGFRYDYQFIQVPDYKDRGEMEPTPHFIQNLGEAEYAVAIYQYMRLLGYPASSISILATYAGQRALIKDVLNHRCAKNRLFGLPKIVTTVDKYQGEQNHYVILSLTRTTRPGYLRDIRRLTVALSRARLGLYILGRREVFEACFELREAFERLFKRPDKLQLTTGEMFPTKRNVDDQVDSVAEMEGVEHLGQYVYEMTQAKVRALEQEMGGPQTISLPLQNGDVSMQGTGMEEGDETRHDEMEG